MAEPIIKIENVDYYYDKGKPAEVHALRDVSLDIQQGEYISFFGPSGCGKSTLLYIISGVEQPGIGRVLVNGQNLLDLSAKELAIYRQVGIGIIFQNFNLIPSIKVIDNVTLPMAFLGIALDKRLKRAKEILERLEVGHIADRYPAELSGGQQQRVGIARALANDPPIILADEPIGNLDSTNATNVLNLLRELNEKDGKTIIMVTHEAWSLRDVTKVFYMKDGALIKTENRKPSEIKKVGEAYYNQKLFPELPPAETHAKILSAIILKGHPKSEIKRLEYFIVQRLKNNIDQVLFREVLDKPFRDGGVGLWKQKAARTAEYVERLIAGKSELDALYKQLEKTPELPLGAEIEKIRTWLLEGFSVELSPFQIQRMDEIIGERIRNIITKEHFTKILDLPKKNGGVGLRLETSNKISDQLETILGQGSVSVAETAVQ